MVHSASYQQLLEGHGRFKKQFSQEDRIRYRTLAQGQSPKVTLVTCSDSRIDPCELTQTKPGDLFVIRNAGNLVPRDLNHSHGEIATLEFAVSGLKTEHIIICGHSDCGAMKGVLNPEACSSCHHVAEWVSQAKISLDRLEWKNQEGSQSKLDALVEANVEQQIINLKNLPFIQEAIQERDLKIHGWVMDIETASIRVYDSKSNQFVSHERLDTMAA